MKVLFIRMTDEQMRKFKVLAANLGLEHAETIEELVRFYEEAPTVKDLRERWEKAQARKKKEG